MMIELLARNFVAFVISGIIAALFSLVAYSEGCTDNESHESIDDYATTNSLT